MQRIDVDLSAGLRRARRTAALARAAMAIAGILVAVKASAGELALAGAVAGFAVILATSLIELTLPGDGWLALEESIAPVSAVLIVGLGPEQVTTRILLWLSCVACGVLARGGRRHWFGRAVLLAALLLPIVRLQMLSVHYAAVCVATIALLLTCGRVTNELRALLQRARHDADHDSLTGLLSRRTFRDELERAVSTQDDGDTGAPDGDGVALLLVDLENFGAVNKSAGHSAGDALLTEVARQISAALGEHGIVGRLGGDEFGAIVAAPDPVARGEELLTTLAAQSGVRALAGLAHIRSDGDDAEGLLRAVDVALRIAKRSGRPGVSVYHGESLSGRRPGGAHETLERLIAGDGLRVAVQPIVAVPDGTIHAYEALARFRTRGNTSPLHWFTLAEELGMRDRLELACLAAALRTMPGRPHGSALTVNLSGPMLLDPRVGAQLDELATLDGLIIELTENVLIEDGPAMHAEINRLLGRGVRFAVDDMGAAYSGLQQLMALRPSYLKLDRALVSGIDVDPDRAALVSAMISYANQTGGRVVAEGVETAEELDTLLGLGVDLVQGYHLARPGSPWPQVDCSRFAPRVSAA